MKMTEGQTKIVFHQPKRDVSHPKVKREAPRERVLRHVKKMIDEKVVVQGERLPAERSLAREVGVSRETVNAALVILANEGVIRSNGGRLRIVQPRTQESPPIRTGLMEQTVQVITPHLGTINADHRQSGWLEYITQGVLQSVAEHGLHSMMLHPDRLCGEGVERLAADRPRGVVLAQQAMEMENFVDILRVLQRANVPIAAHGNVEAFRVCDRVMSDYEGGSFEVAKWLIERGARRVLQVWPQGVQDAYWYAPRRSGYERALREAGLEVLPPVLVPTLPPSSSPDTGHTDTSRVQWLGNARHFVAHLVEYIVGPSAVDAMMLDSDGNTFKAAGACRLCGREPNRDILLAGYDNYWQDVPEREQEPQPLLVTVDKENRRLGRELVQLLLDRVEGRLPPEPQLRLVPSRLIVVSEPPFKEAT